MIPTPNVKMNTLVLLGLATMFLIAGVRLVPSQFTRVITLITLVTLITFPIIIFLRILGIGSTLLHKHLALREAAMLMLTGMESSTVHNEEQWFGRQASSLKTHF